MGHDNDWEEALRIHRELNSLGTRRTRVPRGQVPKAPPAGAAEAASRRAMLASSHSCVLARGCCAVLTDLTRMQTATSTMQAMMMGCHPPEARLRAVALHLMAIQRRRRRRTARLRRAVASRETERQQSHVQVCVPTPVAFSFAQLALLRVFRSCVRIHSRRHMICSCAEASASPGSETRPKAQASAAKPRPSVEGAKPGVLEGEAACKKPRSNFESTHAKPAFKETQNPHLKRAMSVSTQAEPKKKLPKSGSLPSPAKAPPSGKGAQPHSLPYPGKPQPRKVASGERAVPKMKAGVADASHAPVDGTPVRKVAAGRGCCAAPSPSQCMADSGGRAALAGQRILLHCY